MTTDEFRKAIGGAGFALGLHEFCAALNWGMDSYSLQKFHDFQELARLLGTFDAATLDALIAAHRARSNAFTT